jgi:hypothetical protein
MSSLWQPVPPKHVHKTQTNSFSEIATISQSNNNFYVCKNSFFIVNFLLWPSDSDKNLAQGPEFFANINKNYATSGHFQLFSARTATSTLILRMQYDLLLLALGLTQIQARHTISKTFCRFFFPLNTSLLRQN